MVLIPLISGQLFGRPLLSCDLRGLVLIPLISGQLFGHTTAMPWQEAAGLNPFDIRATVRTFSPGRSTRTGSLNPFDIRATVRTQCRAGRRRTRSLNPFDIRATVRTTRATHLCTVFEVLIPLISGQLFGPFHFGMDNEAVRS